MAAVTINKQGKSLVFGNRRVRTFNITAATTGDTLTIPGYRALAASADQTAGAGVFATMSYTALASPTVLTFNYTAGGTITMDVVLIGY